MTRDELVRSLVTDTRNLEVCKRVVDESFEHLSTLLSVEQGVIIEGLGIFNAHYKRKAVLSKQTKVLMEENLSIYFHPGPQIKKRVKKMLDDEQASNI